MDQVPPPEQGQSLDRYAHLPGLATATSWYADYPHQYAGDGSRGTVEQGEQLIEAGVEKLVRQTRAVKQDEAAGRLYSELLSHSQH